MLGEDSRASVLSQSNWTDDQDKSKKQARPSFWLSPA